jgi:Arc/MetJ-type ribon-helix-helix transcriptional regulator
MPKALVERIERIRTALGYSSVSAFIQEAVRRNLNSKEREYDAIQEEREVGRRVLGKKDPGDL